MALVLALAVGPALAQQTAARPATDQLYAKAKAASVEVLVHGHLTGSGWFADSQGLILTAAHVVERPGPKIEVLSPSAGRLQAKAVAVDLGHDLALLKVDPREGGYPALGPAEKPPAPGEDVYLLGVPLYRHAVLLRGTMARDDTIFEYYTHHYIEVTHIAATVPGGMSGGPWLNGAGEVVGLQSAVMSHDSIPVGVASVSPLAAIRNLLKSQQTASTPTMGAAVEELWQQDRKTLDRFPPGQEGLVVRLLQDDGPAVRGGLKQWDLVVAAEGKKVRLIDELLRIVCQKQPGQDLELTVTSPDGAGQRKVTIKLGRLEVGWP